MAHGLPASAPLISSDFPLSCALIPKPQPRFHISLSQGLFQVFQAIPLHQVPKLPLPLRSIPLPHQFFSSHLFSHVYIPVSPIYPCPPNPQPPVPDSSLTYANICFPRELQKPAFSSHENRTMRPIQLSASSFPSNTITSCTGENVNLKYAGDYNLSS